MSGLLDFLGSRNGQTATGGLLGLAAGGPVGLLAGAAGGRLLGGLAREGQRRNTAAEQELEERALRISSERQKQEAVKRQREAMAALPGLLRAQPIPDGLMGPPAPNQMRATDRRIGLLDAAANLSPQAAGATLLSQAFPTPAKPSRLQEQIAAFQEFAGRDPNAAQIAQMVGAAPDPGTAAETRRANAEAKLAEERLAAIIKEREGGEAFLSEYFSSQPEAIDGAIARATRLKGDAALEPGGIGRSTGLGELGNQAAVATGEFFGQDMSGRRGLAADADALGAELDQILVNEVGYAKSIGDDLMVSEIRLLQDAKASGDMSADAIVKVLTDLRKKVKERAKGKGIEVSDPQSGKTAKPSLRWDPVQQRLVPNA